MSKVLVLGGHGMLGSMVAKVLHQNSDLEVSITATESSPEAHRGGGPVEHRFEASRDALERLLENDDYGWIVNAIGVTKPQIQQSTEATIAHAIDINAAFPFRLAAGTAGRGQRVIQIATDGVFSGANGPYVEGAPHDACDVYGKTKSLGEIPAANFIHLRCSIVGDPMATNSLLGWALKQPPGASITGYTNHRWNGVTTWHFAKFCEALIVGAVDDLPSSLHVVPQDSVSKAELLELALSAFGRDDVAVSPVLAATPVDRTLRTSHPEVNRQIWAASGYDETPTIAAMVEELASSLPGS